VGLPNITYAVSAVAGGVLFEFPLLTSASQVRGLHNRLENLTHFVVEKRTSLLGEEFVEVVAGDELAELLVPPIPSYGY
jgi:hypothetical protein